MPAPFSGPAITLPPTTAAQRRPRQGRGAPPRPAPDADSSPTSPARPATFDDRRWPVVQPVPWHRRNDPLMTDGTARLMANLPDADKRDLYFWYYATQVMHNQPGMDWEVWNRRIRNLLVQSQDARGLCNGQLGPRTPLTRSLGCKAAG